MTAIQRIGFIGLGNQGGPIARHLIAAGYEVCLWARRAEALEPFIALGAETAATPADLAARSELVSVCVWDDEAVVEVLGSDSGVLDGAATGTIVAIHSTTRPDTCMALAEQAASRGVAVIDAPVSGGPDRSEAGTLLVMVGGPVATFERCRPVFTAFASDVIRVGAVGAGQKAKLVNNALLTANIGMAADAIEIGEQFGLDGDALLRIVNLGSASSFAASVLEHSRELGSAGALDYLDKDVNLIAQLATHSGLSSRSAFLSAARSGVTELRRLGSARRVDS